MTARSGPDWIHTFGDDLEAFARTLPAGVNYDVERQSDWASLTVKSPTSSHRDLSVTASPGGVEYSLGGIWTEDMEPSPALLQSLLASCDAVRDGGVREVRDRRTGVYWHVYRLRTRGLNRYARDSEYSLWHWLRLKVRRVKIHRLPPLGAAG